MLALGLLLGQLVLKEPARDVKETLDLEGGDVGVDKVNKTCVAQGFQQRRRQRSRRGVQG